MPGVYALALLVQKQKDPFLVPNIPDKNTSAKEGMPSLYVFPIMHIMKGILLR
jgi:hypothetical protein